MKMFKRLGIMMMAVAMMVAGSFAVGNEAHAYSASTPIKMNSNFAYGGTAYIHTSENSYSVFATYEPAPNSYVYVTLTVQRNIGGVWQSVESKSGYAISEWGNRKNFNTQFDNYAYKGQGIRIKVTLRSGHSGSGGSILQTAYSKSWTR